MITIPTGYSIRPTNLDDAPDIVRLRVAMQTEHRGYSEVSPSYLETTQAFFEESLTTNYYRGWLAFAAAVAKPIAVAGYLIHHHPPKPERIGQERGYVISVYIEPAHRRKGLGTALMQYLIDDARSQGFRRLELRSSEEGRYLYSKLGFTAQEVWMLEL